MRVLTNSFKIEHYDHYTARPGWVTSDPGTSLWLEAPEVKFLLLHCPAERAEREEF